MAFVEIGDMERTSGVALWRQIANTLSDEIRSHSWKPGDRLPTEADLAARFAVNRHTLRRAMAALEASGLVRVEQGRGTFVQEDVVDYQVGKRTRFSENIVITNRQPGGRLLRSLEVPADREAARALGVPPGERLLMIDVLREADATPLSVSTHWFPKSMCAGIIEAYQHTGSITRALFQIGIKDYTRKSTRVTTRLPIADEGRLLKQSRSQPVLVSESVNVDPSGIPIEYTVARFAGQRVQFVFGF